MVADNYLAGASARRMEALAKQIGIGSLSNPLHRGWPPKSTRSTMTSGTGCWMTHHLERNHGPRFTKLMDRSMPNWRSLREQLNASPLAPEQWT